MNLGIDPMDSTAAWRKILYRTLAGSVRPVEFDGSTHLNPAGPSFRHHNPLSWCDSVQPYQESRGRISLGGGTSEEGRQGACFAEGRSLLLGIRWPAACASPPMFGRLGP